MRKKNFIQILYFMKRAICIAQIVLYSIVCALATVESVCSLFKADEFGLWCIPMGALPVLCGCLVWLAVKDYMKETKND